MWDGAKNMVVDLGSLIGRDPVTGDWSWGTAGDAWKGMDTFALALSPPLLIANSFTDLPGLPKGTLGATLVNAGKGIIAYDQWGAGRQLPGRRDHVQRGLRGGGHQERGCRAVRWWCGRGGGPLPRGCAG